MDNFKKGGFRGGRRDDRGDRGPVTMHSAVCASCGKPCEVPFRPSGDKPVYCRDCFAGRAAMGGERSNRKDFRPSKPQMHESHAGGNGELKKQLEAVNAKLDKLISIVQEVVLKGALKEVTTESKETPKVIEKMKKVKKVK